MVVNTCKQLYYTQQHSDTAILLIQVGGRSVAYILSLVQLHLLVAWCGAAPRTLAAPSIVHSDHLLHRRAVRGAAATLGVDLAVPWHTPTLLQAHARTAGHAAVPLGAVATRVLGNRAVDRPPVRGGNVLAGVYTRTCVC